MAITQPDKDIYAGLAEARKDEFDLEKKGSRSDYEKSIPGSWDGEYPYPTEEEFSSLRTIPDHVPWGAYRQLICFHVCLYFLTVGPSHLFCRTGGEIFILVSSSYT